MVQLLIMLVSTKVMQLNNQQSKNNKRHMEMHLLSTPTLFLKLVCISHARITVKSVLTWIYGATADYAGVHQGDATQQPTEQKQHKAHGNASTFHAYSISKVSLHFPCANHCQIGLDMDLWCNC